MTQRIYEAALAKLEETRKFDRIASVDRGGNERQVVDMETGRFPMVLATEGEASDGHIISIPGIETQDRMPMLFGHRSDAAAPVLGSVVEPSKAKKDGVRILRSTGQFNLNGEGPLSAVRRDLAQLVNDGDLDKVSFRWDGVEMTRRINLPSNHQFFVDGAKVDFDDPRHWGMLFSKSRALEGSIVAIGADPKAIIGRSEATDDAASRVFLRALAANIDEGTGLADLSAGYEAVNEALDGLRRLGVDSDEIALLIANESVTIGQYAGFAIPEAMLNTLRERDEALLEFLLRDTAETAAQANTAPGGANEAPQGENEESREAEIVRYPDGSIGAMKATDFFEGVGRSMSSAVAGALEKVTGRR